MCWWVLDEALSKVALYAANKVVIFSLPTLTKSGVSRGLYKTGDGENSRNDAESVVLHDGRPRDARKQPLLHSSLKTKYSNLW